MFFSRSTRAHFTNVQGRKCRHPHFRMALIALLSTAFAASAQADNWQSWFNESQQSIRDQKCGTGMNGLRVKGDWSYLKSLSCLESNIAAVDITGLDFSNVTTISENRANTEYVCPKGQVAVGMKCSGEWCDDIQLACARVSSFTHKLETDCKWSPIIAGDGVTSFTAPADHVVTGIRCSAGWCYQNTLRICKLTKLEQNEQARVFKGWWHKACSNAQTCTGKVARSVTSDRSSEDSRSNEWRTSFSAGLSTGFEFAGATVEASVSSGFENAVQQAKTTAQSVSMNQTEECGTETVTRGTDIHAVWQWTMSGQLNGQAITVKTCQLTCTTDGNAPNYLPGSPEDIGTCNR